MSAAEELFSDKGFHNIRLEDISRKIEFSKGIVYQHFKSKDELFAQILLGKVTALLAHLSSLPLTSLPTRKAVDLSLQSILDFFVKHRASFKLLFLLDESAHKLSIPVQVTRDIFQKKLACLEILQEVLRQGQERQEVRPDLSPKDLSLVLWGMLTGLFHLVESRQARRSDLHNLLAMGTRIGYEGFLLETRPHPTLPHEQESTGAKQDGPF